RSTGRPHARSHPNTRRFQVLQKCAAPCHKLPGPNPGTPQRSLAYPAGVSSYACKDGAGGRPRNLPVTPEAHLGATGVTPGVTEKASCFQRCYTCYTCYTGKSIGSGVLKQQQGTSQAARNAPPAAITRHQKTRRPFSQAAKSTSNPSLYYAERP